jgi:hypothetical protein
MFEDLREAKPKALDRSSAEKLKAHFNLDFLKSYASCWPLIAACSVRREQRVGSFAPEFVVPQLLLQWVAQENGFDGLRYFSVWTPTRGMHLFGHSNCVFPVKKVSFKGHCPELTKAFAFTAPISWEALTAVDLGSSSFITNEDSNASAQIQLNSDLPDFEYFRTTFFTTELKLKDVEARPNCSRIMDV